MILSLLHCCAAWYTVLLQACNIGQCSDHFLGNFHGSVLISLVDAAQSVVHEVDQVFVPDFMGVTSSGNRVVYALGDGSGQPGTVANFTLILPGGDQNISDIADPVYQITDAGLMFSVTPPPI